MNDILSVRKSVRLTPEQCVWLRDYAVAMKVSEGEALRDLLDAYRRGYPMDMVSLQLEVQRYERALVAMTLCLLHIQKIVTASALAGTATALKFLRETSEFDGQSGHRKAKRKEGIAHVQPAQ